MFAELPHAGLLLTPAVQRTATPPKLIGDDGSSRIGNNLSFPRNFFYTVLVRGQSGARVGVLVTSATCKVMEVLSSLAPGYY